MTLPQAQRCVRRKTAPEGSVRTSAAGNQPRLSSRKSRLLVHPSPNGLDVSASVPELPAELRASGRRHRTPRFPSQALGSYRPARTFLPFSRPFHSQHPAWRQVSPGSPRVLYDHVPSPPHAARASLGTEPALRRRQPATPTFAHRLEDPLVCPSSLTSGLRKSWGARGSERRPQKESCGNVRAPATVRSPQLPRARRSHLRRSAQPPRPRLLRSPRLMLPRSHNYGDPAHL